MRSLSALLLNKKMPPICAALFAFMFVLYVFYPGFMSTDSFYQLRQARGGRYTDHHPPVMGAVWRQMDVICPGPLGMLAFHNLIFFSALLLLAFTFFDTNKKRTVFILCFTFLPSVFGFLGIIWKDIGMGVTLLLAFAALSFGGKRNSKMWVAVGLVSLLYANLVRHNAFAAVLPICIYAGFVVRDIFPFQRKISRGFQLGVVTFIVLAGLSILINGSLTSEKKHMYQGTLLFDLVGMSIQTQENLVPEVFFGKVDEVSVETMPKYFAQNSDVRLFTSLFLARSTDPESLSELRGAWLSAVLRCPVVYLTHRLRMMKIHYGVLTPRPYFSLHLSINENAMGIALPRHFAQRKVKGFLDKCAETFLFRPIVYLLGLVVASLVWLTCCRTKLQAELSALMSSTVLLWALNFFAMPASGVRYSWWPIIAIWLFAWLLCLGDDSTGLKSDCLCTSNEGTLSR